MPASSTAEWVAAYRAAEAILPGDRSIYRDPDACGFVRDSKLWALIARPRIAQAGLAVLDAVTPGLAGQAFVRYRYFDELLARMLADGLDQVVVLGAGYDATGLRLTRGAHQAVVDECETQTHKRELLAEMDPRVLDRTVFVECDFARDSVAERLTSGGHSRNRRTLFSWLGVSWYLDPPAVDSFLAELASVAAPGSRVVFDLREADAEALALDLGALAIDGHASVLGNDSGATARSSVSCCSALDPAGRYGLRSAISVPPRYRTHPLRQSDALEPHRTRPFSKLQAEPEGSAVESNGRSRPPTLLADALTETLKTITTKPPKSLPSRVGLEWPLGARRG